MLLQISQRAGLWCFLHERIFVWNRPSWKCIGVGLTLFFNANCDVLKFYFETLRIWYSIFVRATNCNWFKIGWLRTIFVKISKIGKFEVFYLCVFFSLMFSSILQITSHRQSRAHDGPCWLGQCNLVWIKQIVFR